MATEPITPAQWLDLLAERAPGLRQAGVTRVEIAGCVADLAPSQAEGINDELLERIAELEASADPPGGDDPLSRSGTFGGGRIPSMSRD